MISTHTSHVHIIYVITKKNNTDREKGKSINFVVMKLTIGAVRALKQGARSGENINAITSQEHIAGQLDPSIRPFLSDKDEYKPVLEVKRTEWFGKNLRTFPMVKFWCVDDDDGDEICVMASPREKGRFAKRFFSKSGPFHTGKMKVGRRFMLLDYTTTVVKKDRVHNGSDEVVHVERMRSIPIPKKQTMLTKWLAKNKNNHETIDEKL